MLKHHKEENKDHKLNQMFMKKKLIFNQQEQIGCRNFQKKKVKENHHKKLYPNQSKRWDNNETSTLSMLINQRTSWSIISESSW